jgi:surfactin synthase thioesterase subunit/acyl carrier protein
MVRRSPPVSEAPVAIPAIPVPKRNGSTHAGPATQGILQRHIMAELGFEQPLDPDRPLNEVGLDSLRAVKLSITLEEAFGIPILVPELIRGPTINELAEHVNEALAAAAPNGAATEHDTSAPRADSPPARAVPIAATEAWAAADQRGVAHPPGADVAVETARHHGEPELHALSARRAHDAAPDHRNGSEPVNGGAAGRNGSAEGFEARTSGGSAKAASRSAGKWLIAPRPNPNAKARLFCFPYAGGGLVSFRSWARSLSSDVELVAVEAPGRGTRINETAVGDIDTFVRELMPELLQWLDRPSAFFGHCLGGLTMFATLRTLPPRHAHFIKHAFACAVRPPHLLRRRGAFEDDLAYSLMLHHEYDVSIPPYAQPDDVFAYIVRQFDTPDADRMLEIPKLRKVLLPAIRAEFGMAYNYHHRPAEPFPFPVTSFVGDADPWVSEEDSAGWSALTRATFTNHLRKGSHFLMMDDEAYILQTIEKELAASAAH